MTIGTITVSTPQDRLSTFFDASQPRDAYDDADIDEIAHLLERSSHIARRTPRLYIVLRAIDKLEALDRLLKEGFDDQWFPVEAYGLPQFLSPDVKARIVEKQSLILTKSLDLEKGRHRHFKPGEALPFEVLTRLGTGGYGQVDRIESKISFRHFALKRIRRRQAFGNNSKEAMKRFLSEIQIVKALKHRHVIEYIGSYTDKTYLGLVMSPVADTDLATFLEHTAAHVQTVSLKETQMSPSWAREQALSSEMCATVRTYFGCLAAALTHLHNRSIRHKDIKPQNILVHKGDILLTDFGLSREFADDIGSTTSGATAITPRYSPPEVAAFEARNTSADIWSLGCVYFEMSAALKGYDSAWIKRYFETNCTGLSHFYANHEATSQLLSEWETTWSTNEKIPFQWIRTMMQVDRLSRPTAASILDAITCCDGKAHVPTTFCGICCVPDEESDSEDSLADGFTTPSSEDQQLVVLPGKPSGDGFTPLTSPYPRQLDNASFDSLVETSQQALTFERLGITSLAKVPDGIEKVPDIPPIIRSFTPKMTMELHEQHAFQFAQEHVLDVGGMNRQHDVVAQTLWQRPKPDISPEEYSGHLIPAIGESKLADPTTPGQGDMQSGIYELAQPLQSSDWSLESSTQRVQTAYTAWSFSSSGEGDFTVRANVSDLSSLSSTRPSYISFGHSTEDVRHSGTEGDIERHDSGSELPSKTEGDMKRHDSDSQYPKPMTRVPEKDSERNLNWPLQPRPKSLPLTQLASPLKTIRRKTSSWHYGWKKGTRKVKSGFNIPVEVTFGVTNDAVPKVTSDVSPKLPPVVHHTTFGPEVFGTAICRLWPTVLEPSQYGACPSIVSTCCAFLLSKRSIGADRLRDGNETRVRNLIRAFNVVTLVRTPVDLNAHHVDVFDVETTLLRYLNALPGYLLPEYDSTQMTGQVSGQHLMAYLGWYERVMSTKTTVAPSVAWLVIQLLEVFEHMYSVWEMSLSGIVERYYGCLFTPPADEDQRHRRVQRRALGYWIKHHRVLWRVAKESPGPIQNSGAYPRWTEEMERLQGELSDWLQAE